MIQPIDPAIYPECPVASEIRDALYRARPVNGRYRMTWPELLSRTWWNYAMVAYYLWGDTSVQGKIRAERWVRRNKCRKVLSGGRSYLRKEWVDEALYRFPVSGKPLSSEEKAEVAVVAGTLSA